MSTSAEPRSPSDWDRKFLRPAVAYNVGCFLFLCVLRVNVGKHIPYMDTWARGTGVIYSNWWA